MESYVLIDRERIMVMFGGWSYCTFKSEEDNFRFWTKEAYRFLVVNGTLLIGAVVGHAELYAAWTLRDESINDDLKERAETVARDQYGARNWAVTAAGIVGSDGEVTGWESKCFRVKTPSSMWSELEQEIKRLFASGALTPQ